MYVKGFSSKRIALKVDVFVTGPKNNYTLCRRVPASFSPEILQSGAVKGLMLVPLLTTYTPVQGYLGYCSRSVSFSVTRSLWSVSSK